LNDYKTIVVTQNGGVATITLARPEQLNALSPELLVECLHALETIAASKEIGVLILAAQGRAFSAGVDLKAVAKPDYTPARAAEFSRNAERVLTLLESMPQVTIAKVHGICFTGGLEVALGCDLIVAADEARFADTHAKLGYAPIWGLSQRLPRRVGNQRAREMSFTAREYSGAEAAAIGLVLKSVPLPQLDAAVEELAQLIVKNNSDSIGAYKKLYNEAQNSFLRDGLQYERQCRYLD